jgi:hypothetical protein
MASLLLPGVALEYRPSVEGAVLSEDDTTPMVLFAA